MFHFEVQEDATLVNDATKAVKDKDEVSICSLQNSFADLCSKACREEMV